MTDTTTTTARKGRGRPRKAAATTTTPVPLVSDTAPDIAALVAHNDGPAAEPATARKPLTAQELADALAVLATTENPHITLRMVNWDSSVPEIEVYNVVDVLPSGTLLWKRFGGEN